MKALSVYFTLTCLLLSGCAPENGIRYPASLKENPKSYGGAEIVPGEIYQTTIDNIGNYKIKREGLVGKSKLTFIAVRVMLKRFLKKLDLDKDVREKIEKSLYDKSFRKKTLPFLWKIKEMYTVSKDYDKESFKAYVGSHFHDLKHIPGFAHSLMSPELIYTKREFKKVGDKLNYSTIKRDGGKVYVSYHDPNRSYEDELKKKRDNKKETEILVNKIIARVASMYVRVYLSDDNRSVGEKPNLDQSVVRASAPDVKQIFQMALKYVGKRGHVGEAIHALVKDDNKIEAVTLSIIKFMTQFVSKSYKTLALSHKKTDELHDWFLSEVNKVGGGSLYDYLEKSVYRKRRYGVHVVVDGLQGHLLEALSSGKRDHPLLVQVNEDHKNFKKYEPKGEKYHMGPNQTMTFLKWYLDNGLTHKYYLPFFKDLYHKHIHSIARQGISTTPTISVRNLPLAMTGAPVVGEGSTGLPNFHFLNRKRSSDKAYGEIRTFRPDRAYYFFGNDALLLDEITKDFGMRTMFERMPGVVTLNCNSNYDHNATASYDGLMNLILGEIQRDFGDMACYSELKARAEKEKELMKLRKKALEYKAKHKTMGAIAKWKLKTILKDIAELEPYGMPQYLQYYNPWPDHFAHGKGPFSNEIISHTGELNRLDYWLGKITDIYKDLKIYDQTLFGMSGDHGLAPTYYMLHPEKQVLKSIVDENEMPILKVAKISSDEGEGPKLTNPYNAPTYRGKYDVIIASTAGGNYMMDFFVDHKRNWDRQPVLSELKKLKTLSGHTINIIDEIKDRLKNSLEYMVVRTKQSNLNKSFVKLINYKSEGVIERIKDKVFYTSKDDILKVKELNRYDYYSTTMINNHKRLLNKCLVLAKKEDVKTWCNEDDWRVLTSYTNKPDSVVQLAHIYDTDFAGTINLFPKDGVGYNSHVPGRHAGENFHEKDAFVGIWGTYFRPNKRIDSAQNGAIAPSIYEWITGHEAKAYENGWGFDSLLKYADTPKELPAIYEDRFEKKNHFSEQRSADQRLGDNMMISGLVTFTGAIVYGVLRSKADDKLVAHILSRAGVGIAGSGVLIRSVAFYTAVREVDKEKMLREYKVIKAMLRSSTVLEINQLSKAAQELINNLKCKGCNNDIVKIKWLAKIIEEIDDLAELVSPEFDLKDAKLSQMQMNGSVVDKKLKTILGEDSTKENTLIFKRLLALAIVSYQELGN